MTSCEVDLLSKEFAKLLELVVFIGQIAAFENVEARVSSFLRFSVYK